MFKKSPIDIANQSVSNPSRSRYSLEEIVGYITGMLYIHCSPLTLIDRLECEYSFIAICLIKTVLLSREFFFDNIFINISLESLLCSICLDNIQ